MGRPLPSLSRSGAQSGNLAILPASALHRMDDWKRVANSLPPGATLIVVPNHNESLRQTMKSVAKQLKADGRHVSAIGADESL